MGTNTALSLFSHCIKTSVKAGAGYKTGEFYVGKTERLIDVCIKEQEQPCRVENTCMDGIHKIK